MISKVQLTTKASVAALILAKLYYLCDCLPPLSPLRVISEKLYKNTSSAENLAF